VYGIRLHRRGRSHGAPRWNLLQEWGSDVVYLIESESKRPIASRDSLLESPLYLPDVGGVWTGALIAMPLGAAV